MARALFSPSWHSVAALRPRLVPQARIHRHVYRGEVWFVVQDQAGGRFHRVTPAAYALIVAMDGSRTVQALWEQGRESSEDACTQTEIVDLLVQLHGANLLQTDTTPDSMALFESYKKKRRAALQQWLLNPMSLKVPLVDPEGFLARWAPRLAWCFGPLGGLLWLAVVLPAVIVALSHWNDLTHSLSDRVLSSSNLLVMACVFPLVKLAHELGHGFATKVWGGTAHEMGLMFLVFAPVPYVDASSSAAFPSKTRRAVVAAAGMLVELFLAALALYVWLLVEPGLVRAIAFNVMLVAGFSTLIVNGNPLLRYDGYYIFCDLIEMPNLAQRGQKYLAYLWDRHVFGALDADVPAERARDRFWLLVYTPLAWCYRTFVTVSIIFFVATKFFIFGVLAAMWAAFSMFCLPLWKAFRHVTSSPVLQRQRGRALRVSAGIAITLLAIAFLLPVPLRTRAEGVVWLPDDSLLHAGEGAFFERWLVPPGSQVTRGTPLYAMRNDQLEADLAASRARVDEEEAKFRATEFDDPVKAVQAERKLKQEKEVQARLVERVNRLVGYADTDGRLVVADSRDMPGQYFKKGDLVGYVLKASDLLARAVVKQDDIDLLRSRRHAIELRTAGALPHVETATLVREHPGAVDELPTPALSLAGGGSIPTLPSDPHGVKTVDKVFLVDLALPPTMYTTAFGERVYVRFDHGYEPLAFQALRRLRQLFLSRFGV